jgi:hypothetical protein
MGYSELKNAGDELRFARAQLERSGASAITTARGSLERAIALLGSASTDQDLPLDARKAALGCRVVVSSHLLAADDFEAVGIDGEIVASRLYLAADSRELEATIRALQSAVAVNTT